MMPSASTCSTPLPPPPPSDPILGVAKNLRRKVADIFLGALLTPSPSSSCSPFFGMVMWKSGWYAERLALE